MHLSNATALTVLSLRDSGIGDQGFVFISTLTNLEYLDLSASQLTDTGIRKATEPRKSATGCDIPAWHCFAGLRWLRLEQSAATLHGLHFLARLPAFEALIWSSASHTIQSPRASVDKSACARRHFRKRQAMSQTQTASHALAEAAADMEFPHAGKLVRDLLCQGGMISLSGGGKLKPAGFQVPVCFRCPDDRVLTMQAFLQPFANSSATPTASIPPTAPSVGWSALSILAKLLICRTQPATRHRALLPPTPQGPSDGRRVRVSTGRFNSPVTLVHLGPPPAPEPPTSMRARDLSRGSAGPAAHGCAKRADGPSAGGLPSGAEAVRSGGAVEALAPGGASVGACAGTGGDAAKRQRR